MTGHSIKNQPGGQNIEATLYRMDRLVIANGHATIPFFALLGVLAGIIVFGGLAVLALGRSAKPFAYGVLFLMNMPLAMLLAVPVFPNPVKTPFTITFVLF